MRASRSSSTLLDAVARVLRRHRRALAAVAAFVAVYAGLSAVRPAPPNTVEVVAVGHTIPAGSALAASDLIALRVPADAVPEGARRDARALVGTTVNVVLPARSIVTDAAVQSGRAVARPGHVVLALPLADEALASVLTPGALIDLLAPGQADAVARDVRVLAFPDSKSGVLAARGGRAILVEVPSGAAAAITAASDAGTLTVVLH